MVHQRDQGAVGRNDLVERPTVEPSGAGTEELLGRRVDEAETVLGVEGDDGSWQCAQQPGGIDRRGLGISRKDDGARHDAAFRSMAPVKKRRMRSRTASGSVALFTARRKADACGKLCAYQPRCLRAARRPIAEP